MHEEDWLRRVKEAHEPNVRQAYAAWLAEQGDPRAELVALEERCRTLGPTCDEYWALKPRRDALRDQTDRAWRKRLGYGAVRVDPPLAWPDDVIGRWRMVREVLDQVQGVRVGDAGRACARARDIEREFKVKLGRSLREWVLLVDDLVRDAQDWWAVFRDSVSLKPIASTQAFSLLIQGEGDYHWAVALSDLAEDDPPVVTFALNPNTGRFVAAKNRTGSYAGANHVTDWARNFIIGYSELVGPHPRLCEPRPSRVG